MPIYWNDIENFFFAGREAGERACPYCGTTERELKDSGFLGCQHCYDFFAGEVEYVFENAQRGMSHTGKRPGAQRTSVKKEIEREEPPTVEQLSERLHEAVLREDYESAAALRDEIKRREGK